MKPAEVAELPANLLRRIVVMEARAKPRLTDIDGLWRNGCKGTRGAEPRPGSITEYIRQRGLLPSQEIDRLIADVPKDIISRQEAFARGEDIASWEELLCSMGDDAEPVTEPNGRWQYFFETRSTASYARNPHLSNLAGVSFLGYAVPSGILNGVSPMHSPYLIDCGGRLGIDCYLVPASRWRACSEWGRVLGVTAQSPSFWVLWADLLLIPRLPFSSRQLCRLS